MELLGPVVPELTHGFCDAGTGLTNIFCGCSAKKCVIFGAEEEGYEVDGSRYRDGLVHYGVTEDVIRLP